MCSRLTSPLGRDDLGISLLGLTSEKPRHKVRLALGKVVGGGGAACLGLLWVTVAFFSNQRPGQLLFRSIDCKPQKPILAL